MTLRDRRSPQRSRTWDDRDRRTMLLNVGFGVTIVASLLLLVLAAGVAWYGDNLAAAATVNGQTVTRAEYRRLLAVNAFRIDYVERRIRTLLTAGRIRPADATARQSILDARKQQAPQIAIEQLVDGRIQAELAEKEGITVSEAEIDARFTEEATTPELRRTWMIEVVPEIPAGESAATPETRAAARAAAEAALAELRGGADWADVAAEVSSDATKEQGGDLGFVDEQSALDPAFSDAVFGLDLDEPTAVLEGADGAFRIGRVTEIVAPVVDATLAEQLEAEGIELADLRAALRRDLVRSRLSDAIVAEFLEPGPQREVAQIFLESSASETVEGAVRTRHILYSPKDDPNGAADLADDDPAWAAAEAAARAAWEKVKADPSLFDSIARAESDEGAAKTSGGKLPYFSPADGIDEAFADAIFADGLRPGQLLEPVRSVFGWHVIQVMFYPTDSAWLDTLSDRITRRQLTFAEAARDYSDGEESGSGGDLGWLGRGELSEELEAAIFAAPIGAVSDQLFVPGSGRYLFLVTKEQVREPDAAQRLEIEQNAFARWYATRKAGYDIVVDDELSGSATS